MTNCAHVANVCVAKDDKLKADTAPRQPAMIIATKDILRWHAARMQPTVKKGSADSWRLQVRLKIVLDDKQDRWLNLKTSELLVRLS